MLTRNEIQVQYKLRAICISFFFLIKNVSEFPLLKKRKVGARFINEQASHKELIPHTDDRIYFPDLYNELESYRVANKYGENGVAVDIPENLKEKADELFHINQFNLVASDLILLNRSLPDIRSKQLVSDFGLVGIYSLLF